MCQVLSDRERDSLLCSDMLAAMKDAGKLDRAAWLQKFSWVGFEQPVDQVFPDGKYGPMTPVGGDTSTADIRCVPLLPNKLWDLPTKDAHIPVSVDVVDGYVVPDVYQGEKPQAVIERQKAVAHALAARNEELQNEAFM